MANHTYKNIARSPIFKQQNIQTTNNLDDNSFSLSKMRSKIHKLKPEDLEETIIEKKQLTPEQMDQMKSKLEIGKECQLYYAWMRHTEFYSVLVKQCSEKNSFSISLRQCSCIILQMNNGII